MNFGIGKFACRGDPAWRPQTPNVYMMYGTDAQCAPLHGTISNVKLNFTDEHSSSLQANCRRNIKFNGRPRRVAPTKKQGRIFFRPCPKYILIVFLFTGVTAAIWLKFFESFFSRSSRISVRSSRFRICPRRKLRR